MNRQTIEVDYHQMLAQAPDPVALLDLELGRLVDVNVKAEQLWGLPEAQLLDMDPALLCPPVQPGGTPSAEALQACIRRASEGRGGLCELTFQHADGHQVACELQLAMLPVAGRRLLHARIVDITRRKVDEKLRAGQGRLLEMVARGAPLSDTLDSLMLLIESQSEGVSCSVLLLDDDGVTLHPASGPSLPPEFMAGLDGLQIGPSAGSCGAAVYRKDVVIVRDVQTDPLWAPYVALVEPFGLRACWSAPIYLDRNQVLGSFAMYYREVRGPSEEDMHRIGVAAHLAGIAIERTRRERELAQHREHLEQMVAARTAELTLAKERADLVNRELAEALDTLSMAQDELVRRDKLAALGALVAGIAHELNTPIGNCLVVAGTIGERARALAAALPQGLRRRALDAYLAEAAEAGDLLQRNLQRAAGLVASFKQIAVDHAGAQRREFSLTELITELATPLRISARGSGVTLDLALEPRLSMNSYPGPLSQVITQLFDNCIMHAFGPAGGGTVRIGAVRRTGELLAVSIEDNGAGIAPAVLPRVFDPFFTTRLGAGGAGLGLHVAHNIVTGILGGRIELHSTVGKGTSFTLLLPVVAPAWEAGT